MTNTIDDRRLVGELYDAAIDPERWTPLRDRVARSVGAKGRAIVSRDPSIYSPRATSRYANRFRRECWRPPLR